MVQFKRLGAILVLLNSSSVLGQTIRFMPFGDSITEITCWRNLIWQRFQTAGYSAVDFVGSMTTTGPDCTSANFDKGHEGHSGYQAVNIANQNQLVGWLQQNPADLITMHLGTNDVVNGRTLDQIIASFDTLITQMRAANPRMRIIVAQIIPLPFQNQPIINLNNRIPTWAASRNSTDSPIWVVDQYTGFSSSDLRDGVHPNASGDQKMADRWYPALINAINNIRGSGPVTSPTSTGPSTTSQPPSTTSQPPVTTPTQPTTTQPSGAQQTHWGQCGGSQWTGPKACAPPYTCTYQNDWYSQCL